MPHLKLRKKLPTSPISYDFKGYEKVSEEIAFTLVKIKVTGGIDNFTFICADSESLIIATQITQILHNIDSQQKCNAEVMSIEFFNENYRHDIETDPTLILFYAHPKQGEELIQFYGDFLENSPVQAGFVLLTLLPCYKIIYTDIYNDIYAPLIISNEDVSEDITAAYHSTVLRASFTVSP